MGPLITPSLTPAQLEKLAYRVAAHKRRRTYLGYKQVRLVVYLFFVLSFIALGQSIYVPWSFLFCGCVVAWVSVIKQRLAIKLEMQQAQERYREASVSLSPHAVALSFPHQKTGLSTDLDALMYDRVDETLLILTRKEPSAPAASQEAVLIHGEPLYFLATERAGEQAEVIALLEQGQCVAAAPTAFLKFAPTHDALLKTYTKYIKVLASLLVLLLVLSYTEIKWGDKACRLDTLFRMEPLSILKISFRS